MIAYVRSVSFDWESGELSEGVRCYRNEQFWHAHEHLECVWLRLKEPEKTFLQALIQISAAFHHLQTGNIRGAVILAFPASVSKDPHGHLRCCPGGQYHWLDMGRRVVRRRFRSNYAYAPDCSVLRPILERWLGDTGRSSTG